MSGIVSRHEGLKVVGTTDCEHMVEVIPKLKTDVVLLGAEAGEEGEPLALLLQTHPRLRVVVIDSTGRHAVAHDAQGVMCEADEVSPDTLVEMLRGMH
jgi:hypothetical protein